MRIIAYLTPFYGCRIKMNYFFFGVIHMSGMMERLEYGLVNM